MNKFIIVVINEYLEKSAKFIICNTKFIIA